MRLIDPKDIHDTLEAQGIDTMVWLMAESSAWASYRIIVRSTLMLVEDTIAHVRNAFVESTSIQFHQLSNGNQVFIVTVHAPEVEKA